MNKFLQAILLLMFQQTIQAQDVPPSVDLRMYDIIENISSDRIEQDIKKLVSFGTRHTLSDTVSNTRGIGAARRWIKSEFENISKDCNNCLEVKYHRGLIKAEDSRRIPEDTWIVNVSAIKRGTQKAQDEGRKQTANKGRTSRHKTTETQKREGRPTPTLIAF